MTTFQKCVKYLAIALAIFLIVSIFGGIFGAIGLFSGNNVLKEVKTYTLSDNISDLNIEISAAKLEIKRGDSFALESNLKDLTVKEKDGKLIIEHKKKGSYDNAMLVFYVPDGTVFGKASINTDAGIVSIDKLEADTMELEFGAGEVNIGTLTANKSADIDGGTGKITISGGTLKNLEIDMGVGQLNLTSAIIGRGEFELGVGETNITLIGHKNEYTVKVEKGVGSVTVDGKSGSISYGSGINNIDIEGGVGSVSVIFKEN